LFEPHRGVGGGPCHRVVGLRVRRPDGRGAVLLQPVDPMTPAVGDDGVAEYSFFGMRPARNAMRPASTPRFIAAAISTGSRAAATAVFISTAAQPISIAIAASDAVPTPASTTTGTVACSRISRRFHGLRMPM